MPEKQTYTLTKTAIHSVTLSTQPSHPHLSAKQLMRYAFTAVFVCLSLVVGYNQDRVGINVDTPQFNLDIRTFSPDLGGNLQLGNQSADHFVRLFPGHDLDPKPFLLFSKEDTFRIATSGQDFSDFTERLTIQPDGDVGIGIVQPINRLHVHDPDVYLSGQPPFQLMFGDENYLQLTNGVSGGDTTSGLLMGVNAGGLGSIKHPLLVRIESDKAKVDVLNSNSTVIIDSSLVVSKDLRVLNLAGSGERPLVVDAQGNIKPSSLIQSQGSTGSGAVRDIDNNLYRTVTIGTQEWMAENLRVTHFNNGDKIPHYPLDKVWGQSNNGSQPAYCWYENNDAHAYLYGALYNWYAVDSLANGGRNVCPTGWHIPSEDEWTTLIDALGGPSIAGGPMKATGRLDSVTGLWVVPNTGATNSSGFSAIGGGARAHDSTGPFFFKIHEEARYWTRTGTRYVTLSAQNDDALVIWLIVPRDGHSVRCIRSD